MIRYSVVIVIAVLALFAGIVVGVNAFNEPKSVLSASTGSAQVKPSASAVDAFGSADDLTHEDLIAKGNASENIAQLVKRLEQTEERLKKHEALLSSLRTELQHLNNPSGGNVASQQEASLTADESQTNNYTPGDREALIAAGLSPDQAISLETRFDDIELRKLYLRDQARRQGAESEEIASQRQQINAEEEALIEEIGDAYGNYLYLTGQTNRVSVQSVIGNSAADISGIRDGDVIYSYAGDRIYNSFDLSSATGQGELGETITVQVQRDEQLVDVYLPRGPMGVQLSNESIAPEGS